MHIILLDIKYPSHIKFDYICLTAVAIESQSRSNAVRNATKQVFAPTAAALAVSRDESSCLRFLAAASTRLPFRSSAPSALPKT